MEVDVLGFGDGSNDIFKKRVAAKAWRLKAVGEKPKTSPHSQVTSHGGILVNIYRIPIDILHNLQSGNLGVFLLFCFACLSREDLFSKRTRFQNFFPFIPSR